MPNIVFILAVLISGPKLVESQGCRSPSPILDLDDIVGPIYYETLAHLCNVRVLTISRSLVSQISPRALCASPFQSLFVRQNIAFPNITRSLFGNCSSLRTVGIYNNINVHLEAGAFSGLLNLNLLFLEDLRIGRIGQDHFGDLKHLQVLKINSCGVNTIQPGAFNKLASLRELDISNNNITHIDGVVRNLEKLTVLRLARNRLGRFPWDDLNSLSELGDLDISRNNITVFDANKIGSLPKLKNFTASFNPVGCNLRRTLVESLKSKIPGIKLEFVLSFEAATSKHDSKPSDCN